MFVVDKGELECTRKNNKSDEKPSFLKKYVPGELFGELALLYNAPRAANIQAKTDCVLFALDRSTFNHIVKESMVKKFEEFKVFLSKVSVFNTLEESELQKIASALQERSYEAGETIIEEGDSGDEFFILIEGEAKAYQKQKEGEKEVFNYSNVGDYFGEIALLENETRKASVRAIVFLFKVFSFKSCLAL